MTTMFGIYETKYFGYLLMKIRLYTSQKKSQVGHGNGVLLWHYFTLSLAISLEDEMTSLCCDVTFPDDFSLLKNSKTVKK